MKQENNISNKYLTQTEIKVIGHIEKIQEANKFKDKEETYDYIINSWHMYDPNWLAVVRYMRENGKLK